MQTEKSSDVDVQQQIEAQRKLGILRREQADKLEGVTDPLRNKEGWLGCMPRPAHDGVPYTVKQLRQAYVAIQSGNKTQRETIEKEVKRKPRIFFCHKLAESDALWTELLSNPQKYTAQKKPLLLPTEVTDDENLANNLLEAKAEIARLKKIVASAGDHKATEKLKRCTSRLERCNLTLRQTQGEESVYRNKYQELRKQMRRNARQRLMAAEAMRDIFSQQDVMNVLFDSLDVNDEARIDRWRNLLESEPEKLADFERRLAQKKIKQEQQ